MTTFIVTHAGSSAYLIDNNSNATINLVRGKTYTFDIRASGHPFYIQTSSGVYIPGNIYSVGITGNGTSSGTLTFVVPSNAPNTLYYVCGSHSAMRGVINITDPTIQCLNQGQSNPVQIENITGLGNVYIFNNVPYDSNGFIGVNNGTYQLTGVPSGHPIGFVINNPALFEVIQGTSVGTKGVDGVDVTHYTGDITFQVKGNFGTISYNCYVHGYMGGQDRLKYSTECLIASEPEPTIQCLTNPSIVNIVESNGNKYVFNNSSSYDSNIVYGLGIGTYVFKNISEGHPMALLNNGKTSIITYTGDSSKKLTKEVDGVSYDFYYGDITVQVNSDFGTLSVYCYYHGYMGGQDLLKYSTTCVIASEPESEPEPQPEPQPEAVPDRNYSMGNLFTRRFSRGSLFTNNAQVHYKSNSYSTGGSGGGVRNSRHAKRKT